MQAYPSGESNNPTNRLSVLLTDDDESLRATVAEVLNTRGFHVLQAGTGLEALNIAQNEAIDLGIFDFHLPDCTGVQLFRRIGRRRSIALPTILMTSDRSDSVADLVTQSGIATLLHKPLQVDPLTRAMKELVETYFSQ